MDTFIHIETLKAAILIVMLIDGHLFALQSEILMNEQQ